MTLVSTASGGHVERQRFIIDTLPVIAVLCLRMVLIALVNSNTPKADVIDRVIHELRVFAIRSLLLKVLVDNGFFVDTDPLLSLLGSANGCQSSRDNDAL